MTTTKMIDNLFFNYEQDMNEWINDARSLSHGQINTLITKLEKEINGDHEDTAKEALSYIYGRTI